MSHHLLNAHELTLGNNSLLWKIILYLELDKHSVNTHPTTLGRKGGWERGEVTGGKKRGGSKT